MRSRLIGIALALAAATTLAGCTHVDQSAHAPNTPEPSASQTVETAAITDDSTIPFGGDCTKPLSEAEAHALIGEDAVAHPTTFDDDALGGSQAAMRRAGGVSCTWYSPLTGTTLSMEALDLDVVAKDRIAAAGPTVCEAARGDATPCHIELQVGDAWLMVAGSSLDTVNNSLAPLGSGLANEDARGAEDAEGQRVWHANPCTSYSSALQTALSSPNAQAVAAGPTQPSALLSVLEAGGRFADCAAAGDVAALSKLRWQVLPGVPAQQLNVDDFKAERIDEDSAWVRSDAAGETTILIEQDGNTLVLQADGNDAKRELSKFASTLLASMPSVS